ncbi:sulfate ABC transporter permease subunit CysT [Deinococcus sp. Arct2-2]|uniref:sulfate ABC transporter permease subunit CysT n=1 Tax=Deinococcus sp. Arct2-2 TaxID=2568653 RepID=UPI0010A50015|nr:sulfate ABC transporter permease subunit CysT [Deinococcus sp. Arct2-2]THF70788.1 sulfate ABC transporter permease subunit CysT [Deinococcus sp. Arct2-2]
MTSRLSSGRPARRHILPGLNLTLGYTLLYLSVIVLIPLAALVLKAAGLGLDGFWAAINTPRVWSALRVSFLTALAASLVNLPIGLVIAWTLTRYRVPGRRLVDALIDLPFALPTAVAGITLTTLLSPNGWLGAPLLEAGLRVAYTPLGIIVALIFIGLPFVVRSLQPVLEDLGYEPEEAALSLGATPSQTFARVILPALYPALLSGFTLALARTIGEYGSVVFISGNLPFKTEIAPLLIVGKLEQYDYAGAAAVAVAMLVISVTLLLAANSAQARLGRRGQA